ncbi:hypothetical protein OIU84_012535 [Salix udensis]|uniref:Uncharacterized protein n=1 Tax=Salix udensis TaxID=889485 RepID=A0AAD6JFU6_9ROSI|nr:hypothetical protein OIU84_012535 [Salix udensis]
METTTTITTTAADSSNNNCNFMSYALASTLTPPILKTMKKPKTVLSCSPILRPTITTSMPSPPSTAMPLSSPSDHHDDQDDNYPSFLGA